MLEVPYEAQEKFTACIVLLQRMAMTETNDEEDLTTLFGILTDPSTFNPENVPPHIQSLASMPGAQVKSILSYKGHRSLQLQYLADTTLCAFHDPTRLQLADAGDTMHLDSYYESMQSEWTKAFCVCIWDTETTGNDPGALGITEFAWVDFDLLLLQERYGRHETMRTVTADGRLIPDTAKNIHGILDGTRWTGCPTDDTHWNWIGDDYLCHIAHNVAFDVQVAVFAEASKSSRPLEDVKWLEDDLKESAVCSKNDIMWPHPRIPGHILNLPGAYGTRLSDIAQSYGVPIVNAHRAMADVQVIAQILQQAALAASGVTAYALVRHAMQPKIRVAYAPRNPGIPPLELRTWMRTAKFHYDSNTKVWDIVVAAAGYTPWKQWAQSLPGWNPEWRPLFQKARVEAAGPTAVVNDVTEDAAARVEQLNLFIDPFKQALDAAVARSNDVVP